MRKQIFRLCTLVLLLFILTSSRKVPSSSPSTPDRFKYFYFKMQISRQSILDSFPGHEVQGILFNTKHDDRFSVSNNNILLNAWLYGSSVKDPKELRLMPIEAVFSTDENKRFSNYQLTQKDYRALVDALKNHPEVTALEFTPVVDTISNPTTGQPLFFIHYESQPIPQVMNLDGSVLKALSFTLNPSPPAQPTTF